MLFYNAAYAEYFIKFPNGSIVGNFRDDVLYAGCGTVIHAKGTGGAHAEKFLGVSLVPEKEMVFIVAKTEHKKALTCLG